MSAACLPVSVLFVPPDAPWIIKNTLLFLEIHVLGKLLEEIKGFHELAPHVLECQISFQWTVVECETGYLSRDR